MPFGANDEALQKTTAAHNPAVKNTLPPKHNADAPPRGKKYIFPQNTTPAQKSRGTKPPPGGINGFNAVKARWDGIERIQEVSESPAQLDFAALQSFSAPDAPKKPPQKPKPQKQKNHTISIVPAARFLARKET